MTTKPAPTRNRKEGISYKSWKNKIQMWQLMTSIEIKKNKPLLSC